MRDVIDTIKEVIVPTLGVFILAASVVLVVFAAMHRPPAPPERHHAVVRQCTPCDEGWQVVCSPEVGGAVTFASPVYREPGNSLYVGVIGHHWAEVKKPK